MLLVCKTSREIRTAICKSLRTGKMLIYCIKLKIKTFYHEDDDEYIRLSVNVRSKLHNN